MHPVSDWPLVAAAVLAIGLSIVLIVKFGLHPFVGLLCGAFAMGLLTGMAPEAAARYIQQGFGDVMGGAGLVIALGLTLGAMLRFSGAAAAIAAAALRVVGVRQAGWGSLAASLLIGLPLFFETGVVLLLPIIAAAAAAIDARRLSLMLPALAGLAILHSLLPPHPGPLLAAHALGANVGRTMLYGLVVALPTALLSGPLFARLAARIAEAAPAPEPSAAAGAAPGLGRALIVVLLPVALIAGNAARELMPPAAAAALGWLGSLGAPVTALLIANLAALALLFGRPALNRDLMTQVWGEAMAPAGGILLSIGAGGALKQVLVAAGMAGTVARFAAAFALPPLVTAWCIAVLIRLGTGSSTVATITTAGLMTGMATRGATPPEWTVLAIGAGSVFFSHVNDAGFWLVKGYLGTSTADTFRTWSVLVTVISVVALLAVLAASRIF